MDSLWLLSVVELAEKYDFNWELVARELASPSPSTHLSPVPSPSSAPAA
eukprot:CAMPEP_0174242144 /NCGR_PEP_ID=MMETSP0417-20130205/26597_1 /TAXON_ID=242541 /ORGANISM="Mayorella sp, Strain BSH-02190019" /LENGTH=48 /DNA_ID= /DNA_START= /DNA_END= /DNA_ORIENTATION=